MRNFSETCSDWHVRPGREPAAEASRRYWREPFFEQSRREFPRHAGPADAGASRPSRLVPGLFDPGMIGAIAAVIGAMAIIGLREKIVRASPPTAAFYSAVGLPVNLPGLEFRDLRARIIAEGSRTVLSVEGEIVNLRHEANLMPPIALTVRGEDGQDRYAWTAQAPKSKLKEGETIAFRARLASPPREGAEVLARFAGLGQDRAKMYEQSRR